MKASTSLPVHNLNTGLNYTTIQEAIDANETVDGQTIFVETGTYYEHVVLNKSLTLIGASRENTIVDGNGTGAAFKLTAQNVSLSNFTALDCGFNTPTMGLMQTSGCIIEDVTTAAVGSVGVLVFDSSNNSISDSKFFNHTQVDLVLENSDQNTIHNNSISWSAVGILLDGLNGSNDNLIADNQISDVGNGVDIVGFGNDVYTNEIWHSDGAGVVLDGVDGNTTGNVIASNSIWNGTDGVTLANAAEDNTVVGNNISNNSVSGVHFEQYSQNNSITVNIVQSNLYGFYAEKYSQNNSIMANIVQSNVYGFYAETFSGENSFVGNTFQFNGYSFYADQSSTGSTLYHNNFISTTVEALGFNTWDNGFEGNYWSDYNGTDVKNGSYQNETGSDGIGDTPQAIDANNTDYFPLMGMFHSYNVTYFTLPMEGHFCEVTVISNSTVSGFFAPIWLEHPEIIGLTFNVTGTNDSTGFCRVSIPTAMMNGTYQVSVNGTEVPYILLPCSNDNVSYLYFTYKHSTEQVIILPEFPSFLILPLMMMATLLAVIIYKKKGEKTSKFDRTRENAARAFAYGGLIQSL